MSSLELDMGFRSLGAFSSKPTLDMSCVIDGKKLGTSPFDKIIILCHKLADIWTPHIREPGTGREYAS
jgi:hypothetical protein